MLKDFNCYYSAKDAEDDSWADYTKKCDEYWKEITKDKSKVIYPQDAKSQDPTQKMLHYTIIFQVFVFMQIFNLINSRKIGEELNVFSHFFNNKWFIIIFVTTIIIQCVLVELGGSAVKTYPLNLN